MNRHFAILDRDGTINVERHYLSDPDQVELVPGAATGMRRIQELGWGIIIVTNQSGIGRGLLDERRLESIHQRLRTLLAEEDVVVDAIYHCPHTPEDLCRCRKPEIGLVENAVRDFGFATFDAVVIGDKECDIELGRRVGATTILVATGYGSEVRYRRRVLPDHYVPDLNEAAVICGEKWTKM